MYHKLMIKCFPQSVPLFPSLLRSFPSTRFQGSKAKLTEWIWDSIKNFSFDSSLDAFGGTGAVAYRFKQAGKIVTYNDNLKFNSEFALALIENRDVTLAVDEVEKLQCRKQGMTYKSIVQTVFSGIYFLDDENQWIDTVIQNIATLENKYKRAIAFFALSQACIIKRPYNLFHRRNLYMRTAEIERSFGNKKTWDRPFSEWFSIFVKEANSAIFDNERDNKVLTGDALDVKGDYDLIYLDPPYISSSKNSVDYRDFYHFLEGLHEYNDWETMIDYKSKHRRLIKQYCAWCDPNAIENEFYKLFDRFKNSIIVVSYRSDGIPSIEKIVKLLSNFITPINVIYKKGYKYALSTNGNSDEVLIIGGN